MYGARSRPTEGATTESIPIHDGLLVPCSSVPMKAGKTAFPDQSALIPPSDMCRRQFQRVVIGPDMVPQCN
jgi:hypothetical protein